MQKSAVKSMAGIVVHRLGKRFAGPTGDFHALREIDLHIEGGQIVAIVGRSGSGKSTLLNMVAGLDRASEGQIYVGRTAVHSLNEDGLAGFRGTQVGVVFQFFQLLPTLTIVENVLLPMDFVAQIPRAERREKAMYLLDLVGIADQESKLSGALSGGQQQRAAIARALANDPMLVVADEPTGNLDRRTANAILEIFSGLAGEGKTVLLATHDPNIRHRVDRTVELDDGRIVADTAPYHNVGRVS